MTLLVDALDKANHERRQKMALSLEDEASTFTPPNLTESPKYENLSLEPNRYPHQTISYKWPIVLLLIILLLIAGSTIYWFYPKSYLQIRNVYQAYIGNSTILATQQSRSIPESRSRPEPQKTLLTTKTQATQHTALPVQQQKTESLDKSHIDDAPVSVVVHTPQTPLLPYEKEATLPIGTPDGQNAYENFETPKITRTARKQYLSNIRIKRQQIFSPLLKARRLLKNGEYDKARRLYLNYLKRNPYQTDALKNLGVIAYNLGKYQEARKWFRRVLDLHPNDPYAHSVISALEVDNVTSTNEITPAVGVKSQSYHAQRYFIQGNRLAEQGLWAEAQHQFFLAWTQDTKNPDYAYNLAVALEYLEKPKLAYRYYQQALNNIQGNEGEPTLPQFSTEAVRQRIQALQNNP